MKPALLKMYQRLKEQGLSPQQEEKILMELQGDWDHGWPIHDVTPPAVPTLYGMADLPLLQDAGPAQTGYAAKIRSIDDLMERDKLREKDGFPRKIKLGKLIKPGKSGKDKVVIVPTTSEEKFMHDRARPPDDQEGDPSGGTGDGQEGEVIGEQPVQPQGGEGEGGAGQGQGGEHEIESNAYDLGRILTEQFELPNLQDKGKKRSLTRYSYDLTDRNQGYGQVLDKKATLKRIVKTNISLGRVPDFNNIDTTRFIISPQDKIYRILSKEMDYESQAVVFFVRDYSGSMAGNATQLVVTQHVLIYSWLTYQYANQVETRFILHDSEAKEVDDFATYYNSKVAGGTQVAAAYRLVNEIILKESLAQDYNIYVFHGTDGDDWDTEGKETLPELKKILQHASRVGITIAEHPYSGSGRTEVERYLRKSELLNQSPKLLRLDTLKDDSDEPRIIEGIKTLIS